MRVLLLLVCAALLRAQPYLIQRPTLGPRDIVFSFAGDLWSVSRQGGDARRLTVSPGIETRPVFSPDGKTIAFTGEYDGNIDVFVMPAEGGVPKRITFHPGMDLVEGWTPDGKRILFTSSRHNANMGVRLFSVPAEGGFPEELPLPLADEGSLSPDGSRLAYVPLLQWQPAWKRYRGGQTKRIWIADLADSSVVPIPRDNTNDFNPMWSGDRVYFLSDRDGPASLYSYDVRSKQVKALLDRRATAIQSASLGPGAIIFADLGSLHLFDLKTGKTTPVPLRIAGDFLETRPKFTSAAKHLREPGLSPNGARAVFGARGEIVTVPAEKGDPRNLTNTPGARDRGPAWSPDGKTIAWFSDEPGEWAIHLRGQDGTGEVRKIPLPRQAHWTSLHWSPDSTKLAFLDNHLGIWYADVESKRVTLVDTDHYLSGDERAASWSPDSKWLTYPKQRPSYMTEIRAYSLAEAKSTAITDGMSDAAHPVFDKNGKYLYFLASTDSGARKEPDVLSRAYGVTQNVYVVVLAKDQPSPLAPENDDEKAEAKKPDDKKEDAKKEEPKKVEVKIDLDRIGQRILALPMPPRDYEDLFPGKEGILYVAERPPSQAGAEHTLTIQRFDLATRKAEPLLTGVASFQISFNGEKILYKRGETWSIAGAAPPIAADKGALKVDAIELRVEPREEWRQMYAEVWRIYRDFFYDPAHHGLDLTALSERYRPFLETLSSRRDLNRLFAEMLSELSVGHIFGGGGDEPEVKRVKVGLLGADYKIENGRYRIARIYDGENWNPDLKAPLTQPGTNAAVGDYVFAVNGRELRGSDDIHAFFEATAGKSTVVKIGPDSAGAGARDVTVIPVDDEFRLRHLAWVEANRRTVDKMTEGRVAYLYMPDTTSGGSAAFRRYFYAQVDKEAAIIDDRFNGGGQIAMDIVERLKRNLQISIITRDGADMREPQGAIYGPKVMLINEFAGSGGDIMPWLFRRAGVGKLIGRRTWGGVIGMAGAPDLMDGGFFTVPNALISNPNGQWELENQGAAPDIEVEMDPKAVREGRDPQLEKAIEVVMDELRRNPPVKPKRPPFPR